MKKKLYIMAGLVLMSIFTLISPLYAITQPLPELNRDHLFVQDHAHVLSDAEIAEMNDLGKKLEKDTGIEMLMVTMDQVNEPRRDYALHLLRGYGVGKKDINNGIVIFLNLDEENGASDRGIEIQIGYGLEGYFTDSRVGAIIDDYGLQDLKEGNYNTGLKNIYRAMYDKGQNAYQHTDKNTKLSDNLGTKWYFLTHRSSSYYWGHIKELLLFFGLGILYPIFALYVGYLATKDKDKGNNSGGGGGRPSDTNYYGGYGGIGDMGTSAGDSSGSSGGFSGGGGGFGGGSGGGGGAGRGF